MVCLPSNGQKDLPRGRQSVAGGIVIQHLQRQCNLNMLHGHQKWYHCHVHDIISQASLPGFFWYRTVSFYHPMPFLISFCILGTILDRHIVHVMDMYNVAFLRTPRFHSRYYIICIWSTKGRKHKKTLWACKLEVPWSAHQRNSPRDLIYVCMYVHCMDSFVFAGYHGWSTNLEHGAISYRK